MKGIFAYVLEFMLTLGNIAKYQYFNVQKVRNPSASSILKVRQAFHTVRIVLYIGCSGPVIGSSTATY